VVTSFKGIFHQAGFLQSAVVEVVLTLRAVTSSTLQTKAGLNRQQHAPQNSACIFPTVWRAFISN
jgi:hypothetical protein